MSNSKWQFRNQDGEISRSNAIFPILKGSDRHDLRVVGTGFYISGQGIFVTAKHCFQNEQRAIAFDQQFHVLQFLPDNQYLIRPVTWGWHSSQADVSVGIAAPITDNRTSTPFVNQSVTLSAERPPIGTEIVTFAFGGSAVSPGERTTRVEARECVFNGKLIRYYPYGRDTATMPWACYETDMRITAGSSGGPVFNGDRGTAFAINTSSIEGSDDISFVTPIDVILDAEFDSVRGPNGELLPRRIRDLAERGWISFEPPLVARGD